MLTQTNQVAAAAILIATDCCHSLINTPVYAQLRCKVQSQSISFFGRENLNWAVAGAGVAAGGGAMLAAKGGAAALSGGAAAVRGGATAAGAATAAYSVGALGQSGAAGVASGLGGVARAAGSAAVSPLKRAVSKATESVKSSFSGGARAAFGVTGGSSTAGTVSGGSTAPATSSASAGTAPAWAQQMRRSQAMNHGTTMAAHAVRSGDSHGSGSSINLSESDRT